jgi:hypothetical protein
MYEYHAHILQSESREPLNLGIDENAVIRITVQYIYW